MKGQPTQGEVVKKVLQDNGNRLVTYKQLMDAADIDTRQRLHTVIKSLIRKKNLPIKIVRADGYIYQS